LIIERERGKWGIANLVIEGIIEKVRPVGVSLHESVLEEFLQTQPKDPQSDLVAGILVELDYLLYRHPTRKLGCENPRRTQFLDDFRNVEVRIPVQEFSESLCVPKKFRRNTTEKGGTIWFFASRL